MTTTHANKRSPDMIKVEIKLVRLRYLRQELRAMLHAWPRLQNGITRGGAFCARRKKIQISARYFARYRRALSAGKGAHVEHGLRSQRNARSR